MEEQDEIILAPPIETEKKAKKPKKPMTEKQLETARRNMEKGRLKRQENIMAKKMQSNYYTVNKNIDKNDLDDDSDEEYEEIVYLGNKQKGGNIQPKDEDLNVNSVKQQTDPFVNKLAGDIETIKMYLLNEKKQKRLNKKEPSTIVNVQVPSQAPPAEHKEAQQIKKKILFNFGSR